jgi:hypothetical protein
MCEDCTEKYANYGIAGANANGGTSRRWCSGCAKAHKGAVFHHVSRCVDCKEKTPYCGLPTDVLPNGTKSRKWCIECAKKHPGAVDRRGSVKKKRPMN